MLVHPVGLNGEAHSLAPAVPAAPTDQHGAGRREVAASARPGPGIRSAGPEAAGQTALPGRACEWRRRPVRRRGAARSEALCGAGGGAARGRGRGVVGAELEELDQLWICMDACIYVCMYVSIYLSMYNLSPSGLDGQPRDARRIASGEPAEGREPLRLRRASKVEWRAPPPSFPAKVEGPRLRRCQSPQGGEEGGRTLRRRATLVPARRRPPPQHPAAPFPPCATRPRANSPHAPNTPRPATPPARPAPAPRAQRTSTHAPSRPAFATSTHARRGGGARAIRMLELYMQESRPHG